MNKYNLLIKKNVIILLIINNNNLKIDIFISKQKIAIYLFEKTQIITLNFINFLFKS